MYYVHLLDADPESGSCFESRSVAIEALAESPNGRKITFIPSDAQTRSFRARERSRFSSGEYVRVPWAEYEPSDANRFPHLSLKTPGLVAFTKTPEHGEQDRQTAIAPGKYLDQFFKGTFTTEQYRSFVGACKAETLELKIARTAEEIVDVYHTGRVTSCMDRAESHFPDRTKNPTRAYGNSDLGIAWFGEPHNARARTIVWPERKLYGTLKYGDTSTLRQLLEEAGYTYGSMQGAKIRAIKDPHGRGYVMPYIDGIDRVSLQGRHFILDNDGSYDSQVTCGYTDEEENTRECSHCGSDYTADEDTDPYCCSCNENRTCCANCDRDLWPDDDDCTSTNDGWYCERCVRSCGNECALEGCSNRWFDCDVLARQRYDRADYGTTDLCLDCGSEHTYCSECDSYFARDEEVCPDCIPEGDSDDDSEAESADTPEVLADTPLAPVIPADTTVPHTLVSAIINSYWMRVDSFTYCNIADCKRALNPGDLALHMNPVHHGSTSPYYCRECVQGGSYVAFNDAPLITTILPTENAVTPVVQS